MPESKTANKRSFDGILHRNSVKALNNKRRQVYKPVLDSPYPEVVWPVINSVAAEEIFNGLTCLLEKISDVALNKEGITVGFNSTTKTLEEQAQRQRVLKRKSKSDNAKFTRKEKQLSYVFICKDDIRPKLLVEHFPVLCYTASYGQEDPIKLVQLSKGSKEKLGQIPSLKHVASPGGAGVIGLSKALEGTAEFKTLATLVESNVQKIHIPWLENMPYFNKPMINVIKTTAPILPKKNDQKQKNKKGDSKGSTDLSLNNTTKQ